MTSAKENHNQSGRQLIISDDGSHTLFVPQLGEHYHSTHGALQESRHIFIGAGFGKITAQLPEINLLEIGLGTGLNALLTSLEAEHRHIKVNYVAVEPFPLDESILSQLNYPGLLNEPMSSGYFSSIHQSAWNTACEISLNFNLYKIDQPLLETESEKEHFHLVYFDAFSPEVQPEMWTENVFSKVYQAMKPGGILVTYCCKGIVKRALKASGFRIEKLPGPPGKREILRATKLSG